MVRPWYFDQNPFGSDTSDAILFRALADRLSKNIPPDGGQIHTPRTMPLVGVPGIEPGTSSLSGTRSNHLSYTPSRPDWWRQPGSNRRPRACKARALPTELCPLPADSSCRDPLGPPRTPRVNETSCSKPAFEAKAERLGGPRLRHSRNFGRSSLTTRTVNPRRRPSRQPAP